MPIYEFECNDCDEKFEDLVPMRLHETCPETECPKCQSKSWTKIMSCSSFNFTNPEGTDRWNSGSSGHDYRFKHNIPKVKQERDMAEALSHMGSDPYGSPDQVKQDIEMDTGIHDPETRPGLS